MAVSYFSQSKSVVSTSVQSITPALKAWLIDHLRQGFAPDGLMSSMLQSGWNEATARAALSLVVIELQQQSAGDAQAASQRGAATEPLHGQPIGIASAQMVGAGARVASAREVLQSEPITAFTSSAALPAINLASNTTQLALPDRLVTVAASLSKPQIVVLQNFLSDEECDALIDAAKPRLARSLTVVNETGGEALNDARTSYGMFFQRSENEVVSRIESRIAALVNWPLENGEGMQVLNYGIGAEYKPHYDYFDPAQPGTPTILKRGGQRVATLIIYLNNPQRGGATVFPDLNLSVSPNKGNAVFFSYAQPHPSSKSLHGGAPVVEGEKWIATKWLREREFQ